MSFIHEASQIEASLHSPALLELLETKVSRTLIEYLVDCVYETVDYALGRPSSSRGRTRSRSTERANFMKFVTHVLEKADVKISVVLVTLVYIDRAKPELEIALEQWACERVFLGALILANKFLNDSTLKNVHWARCTGVFRIRDIGRIEREFLEVLAFNLNITESDVLSHHAPVMAVVHPNHHTAQSSSLFSRVAKRLSWDSEESTVGSDSDSSKEVLFTSHTSSVDETSSKSADRHHFQLTPPPTYDSNKPVSHTNKNVAASKPHHHHHRFSSAFQVLRSIPIAIPNFRTSPVSNTASSPSTSASDSDSDPEYSPESTSPIPPSSYQPSRSSSYVCLTDSQSSSVLPVSNERCRPGVFQRVSSSLIIAQA